MGHKLVIFDCGGTLIDSQHHMCAGIERAFAALGLRAPARAEMLGIVGLSLPQAFAVLAADHSVAVQAQLVELYRRPPGALVHEPSVPPDPPFAGISEVVAALSQREDIVLGIATGKSRRGVARVLARERWAAHFLTIQTADEHPSKPHPSMILQAIVEAGVDAAATLMVGDTTYDMEMAANAEVGAVGVAWGYHPPERLTRAGAHAVAPNCAALLAIIDAQLLAREAIA